MPGASHVGVSQRIDSESERNRLKKVVSHYCLMSMVAFIIHYCCRSADSNELAQMRHSWSVYGSRYWNAVASIKARASFVKAGIDFKSAYLAWLRGNGTEQIQVDSRRVWKTLKEFTSEYVPELTDKTNFIMEGDSFLSLICTILRTKFSALWIVKLSSSLVVIDHRPNGSNDHGWYQHRRVESS